MALMRRGTLKEWWSKRRLEDHVAMCVKHHSSPEGAKQALVEFGEYYEHDWWG
jgi:hypothetical protein